MKVEIANCSNAFIEYLCSFVWFDSDRLTKMMKEYVIGATEQGEPIFWHINAEHKITNGRILTMDSNSGKVYDSGWYYQDGRQACLFGEHLLKNILDKPVALVKDEMTAAVMSCFPTPYVWLAIGKETIEMAELLSLHGRTVVLFPDKGDYEHWKGIANTVTDLLFHVSDVMEKSQGSFQNIAQIVLSQQALRPTKEEVALMTLEEANPCLAKLVEALDLEVISISDIHEDKEDTKQDLDTSGSHSETDDIVASIKPEQERRWHGRNPECHMCPQSHEGLNGTFCGKLNRYVEYGKGDCDR